MEGFTAFHTYYEAVISYKVLKKEYSLVQKTNMFLL